MSNSWSADCYAQHAGFVSTRAEDLLGCLQPQKGERILNFGCGDSVLTANNNQNQQIEIDPNLSVVQLKVVNKTPHSYPFILANLPLYANTRVAIYLQPLVVKIPFIIPEPINQK